MLLTFSVSMTCIGILFKIDLLVPLFLLRKTAPCFAPAIDAVQATHAEKSLSALFCPLTKKSKGKTF